MTDAREVMAKRLDTARARCALAGVVLVRSTDDRDRPTYIVSRWGLTKQLDSLDAVEKWLEMVTGQRAEVAAA